MKMNLKVVKLLPSVLALALILSACAFGAAQPAATQSGQAALQTAVHLTLTALAPGVTPASATPLPSPPATVPPAVVTSGPLVDTPTFTPNRRSKTSSWVKTGYPDQQSGGNESRENIGNPTKASLAQW